MQKPTDLRLIAAGLLGGSSVLLAVYGNSTGFTTRKEMAVQRAFTIATQYQLVHAIAIFLLAVAVPNGTSSSSSSSAASLGDEILKNNNNNNKINNHNNKYLSLALCCFVVGSLAAAVPTYWRCHSPSRGRRWLDRLSSSGGAVLLAGWAALLAAAVIKK